MYREKLTTLARMKSGESGMVVQIAGGHGITNRLSALGIMPGKRVTKVGSMPMHGPVTIVVDRVQIAIGFGIANKVVINLD